MRRLTIWPMGPLGVAAEQSRTILRSALEAASRITSWASSSALKTGAPGKPLWPGTTTMLDGSGLESRSIARIRSMSITGWGRALVDSEGFLCMDMKPNLTWIDLSSSPTSKIAEMTGTAFAGQPERNVHTRKFAVNLACREGLEPPTPNLEGSCSIRMSYRQVGADFARLPKVRP